MGLNNFQEQEKTPGRNRRMQQTAGTKKGPKIDNEEQNNQTGLYFFVFGNKSKALEREKRV